MPDFAYEDLLPGAGSNGADETPWRLLTTEGVATVEGPDGRTFLSVAPEALRLLAETAMHDIAHYLRPGHLAQLRTILEDPEASNNDKFVALDLLKNVNISAGGILPMCQDTGTAIVMGKRGQHVLTEGDDEAALSRGVHDAYTRLNLRYSQMAPVTMWEEKNTGNNLPAQVELYADTAPGHETAYKFLFMAKGGGSANKSYLYQETKAILNPDAMIRFLDEKLRSLGTAACPPYHLAIVIGGTSAEFALKTAKYASTKYLDALPDHGDPATGHGFRDREMEEKVLELTRQFGIGAQFGGKYFCHDVRVIRLARHGGSLPVGMGVSCSADRQVWGRIDAEGIWLEALETDPAHYLPQIEAGAAEPVRIDLDQPMDGIRKALSALPVAAPVLLSGTMIVARDLVHAELARRLAAGQPLPAYMVDHPIYYAGPAKTPQGFASGSFGPTTAARMDSYVPEFQTRGGTLVTIAKGNRARAVTDSCKAHGGFYLGSVGGAAAVLGHDVIEDIETIDFPEFGMEAVWRIRVRDFPAFVIIDDKGGDFFASMLSAK